MEPFLAQIMLFGANWAPRGWALCYGQLLPISQNQALYSLLGTTYGGDGRTNFALPDLRGRTPIHPGTGPGLPTYQLGDRGGSETNTLLTTNMPTHNHTATMRAESQAGTTGNPTGNQLGVVITGGNLYVPPNPSAEVNMGSDSIVVNPRGGSQPYNNMQPFQVLNYIIALQGIFPSRN